MSRDQILVYRSLKRFDESLPDYLERLSFFNGFLSVNDFIRYLEAIFLDLYGEVSSFDMGICKRSSDQFRPYGERLAKCCIALEILLNIEFSKKNMNLTEVHLISYFKPRRICELCWKESSYYRYYWRFWSYRDCHKHGISLSSVKFLNYKEESQIVKEELYKDTFFRNEKYYRPLKKLIPFCEKREYGFIELDRISRHILLEVKAWMIVWKLLYKQFKISSHIRSYEIPNWAHGLNSQTSEKRFKKALSNFILPGSRYREVIEIVSLIVFSFVGDIFENNKRFRLWLLSRAYSYSPLLYICMNGVSFESFNSKDERCCFLPPVKFSRLSLFQLSEFIRYAPILSSDQKGRLQEKLGGFGEKEWDEKHPDFGEYIRLASQYSNILRPKRYYPDGGKESSKSSAGFVV